MTTVRRGIPTERPPLSIEQRLHLAAKRAEQGVQAAAAADGRVDDVLSGDEVFSAVNVGGTDVKPFLDKTDGAALVDADGLAVGVVDTAALSTTAIRPGAPATTCPRSRPWRPAPVTWPMCRPHGTSSSPTVRWRSKTLC